MEPDPEIPEFIQEAWLEVKTSPNDRPTDTHEEICPAGKVSAGLNGYQRDGFNDRWMSCWKSTLDEEEVNLRKPGTDSPRSPLQCNVEV